MFPRLSHPTGRKFCDINPRQMSRFLPSSTSTPALEHLCASDFCCAEKVGGHGPSQLPHERDRPLALVRHVVDWTQEGVRHGRPVLFLPGPHEQQDLPAQFAMLDVSLACRRLLARERLRLPVEQRGGDGVILVERGWRVGEYAGSAYSQLPMTAGMNCPRLAS